VAGLVILEPWSRTVSVMLPLHFPLTWTYSVHSHLDSTGTLIPLTYLSVEHLVGRRSPNVAPAALSPLFVTVVLPVDPTNVC
jgi:hypothetical protein